MAAPPLLKPPSAYTLAAPPSRKDAPAEQIIFLCRVALGRTCRVGEEAKTILEGKRYIDDVVFHNANSLVFSDRCCDSVVVFDGQQVLPEYVVRFQQA